MKTLVVGNSLDVLAVIESVLGEQQNADVTFFAPESVLPYDRMLLPAYAAGTLHEHQLHTKAESFFKQYHPQVVANESLARISVKRKHLTTEKKTQINYDRLVLCDTGHLILPAVKGHQRAGVFDCWRLPSVKALKKHLPFVDSVTVAVTKLQGLDMACALNHLKKEVTVVSSGIGILPEILDEETGLLLKQILEGKGIHVFAENAVEEILGEGEVKAVRLKSGKVLASDCVLFDEARVDLRMLSEPTLTDDDQICVEECFKPAQMPFVPSHFGQDVLDGFLAGWTRLPEGGREYLKFDGPQNVYKKIYAHGDHMQGVVVFNAPQDNERLLGILQRQDNITGKEEEIL